MTATPSKPRLCEMPPQTDPRIIMERFPFEQAYFQWWAARIRFGVFKNPVQPVEGMDFHVTGLENA